MIQAEVLKVVGEELAQARFLYQPFQSPHEGYAIILEELDELKAEIFKKPAKRSQSLMLREARHVAAMAARFILDFS